MHDEIVNHPVNNGPSNALPFPYLLSLFISQNPLPWTKSKIIYRKYRWIVVDIYQAAKLRGKYPPFSLILNWIVVLVVYAVYINQKY